MALRAIKINTTKPGYPHTATEDAERERLLAKMVLSSDDMANRTALKRARSAVGRSIRGRISCPISDASRSCCRDGDNVQKLCGNKLGIFVLVLVGTALSLGVLSVIWTV